MPCGLDSQPRGPTAKIKRRTVTVDSSVVEDNDRWKGRKLRAERGRRQVASQGHGHMPDLMLHMAQFQPKPRDCLRHRFGQREELAHGRRVALPLPQLVPTNAVRVVSESEMMYTSNEEAHVPASCGARQPSWCERLGRSRLLAIITLSQTKVWKVRR